MLASMPKHPTREQVANACMEILDTGFFRALCEPVRVEILRQLILKGRSDVNTIAEGMPQDRSVIARHLQLMERAGLLHSQTQGRHTFYEIDGPAIVSRMSSVTSVLQSLVPMCCPPVER
ncbi:MAG: winged helix-turn-helix domain-containing protein [Rhizobacter sp.]